MYMAKRYEPKDLDVIFKELAGESARATITVSGSLLEHTLEGAIRTALRDPANANEEGMLFSEMGLIGTFYEKVWLAYFLHIIGPATRRDMDLIRSIRNEVAHDMNPVSFDTDSIKSRCLELRFVDAYPHAPRGSYASIRDKFLATTHLMTACLHLYTADRLFQKAKDTKERRKFTGQKSVKWMLTLLAQ
jgi:hypothetical protein